MGKHTKRKKSFYLAPNKRHCGDKKILNTIGYLGTCSGHEDVCVRECYTLLNEFADKLYGKVTEDDKEKQTGDDTTTPPNQEDQEAAPKDSSDEEEQDVDAALKKEISAVKTSKNTAFRFQSIRCDVPAHIYVRTTLDDPLPTLLAAMDDIKKTQKPRTKFLVRLLPVHAVCKSYHEDIEKTFKKFCTGRFKDKESFYAIIKVKSTTTVDKTAVLGIVLKVMKEVEPDCEPVVINPDVSIIITVLKTRCFITEAPLFEEYKKYNLQELAITQCERIAKKNEEIQTDDKNTADEEKSAIE